MAFKILFFICVFIYLGKAEDNYGLPDFSIDESYTNIGPSIIQSIKGKFYEEKQTYINAKPETHNEDFIESAPQKNVATRVHNILSNISNTEQPKQTEKIIYRRNKGTNQPIESLPQTVGTQKHFKKDIPKKSQTIQVNDTDSKMRFQTENVLSSYDKNKTFETIKKELTFDSLIIKNNFSNFNTHRPPIIDDKPVMLQMDPLYRRFETNPNDGWIDGSPFEMHLNGENNYRPSENYGNSIPKHVNAETNNFKSFANSNNFLNDVNTNNNNNYETTVAEKITVPNTPIYEANNNSKIDLINKKMDKAPTLRQNNYNFVDKNTCEDKESDEIMDRSGNEIKLGEPTKGVGITNVGKYRPMLIDHPRVCYACSSIDDLSCWLPDRTTAVKYCRSDHPSCVAKFYKYKGLSYIIRDCGNTCEQNVLAGGPTKYTSCTICHHDLCNNADYFKVSVITMSILLLSHLIYEQIVSCN